MTLEPREVKDPPEAQNASDTPAQRQNDVFVKCLRIISNVGQYVHIGPQSRWRYPGKLARDYVGDDILTDPYLETL
jgi:hypothetical protein